MELKSLCCVLNLLIENSKGDETYYVFDSNGNLIVKKMSVKMMLGHLGYYVLLCQPVLKIVEKNIILYSEVFINDIKR